MRTNKLFLAAAALAAGVLGASAQSNVYSLNIVGYINVTVPKGQQRIVVNQLKASPDQTLPSVLPAPPNGISFLKWKNGSAGFINNSFVDGAWDGDQPTVSFAPGEAAFITAPSDADATLTFVGEVVTSSTNTITAGSGLRMLGSILPQAGTLDALGFPQMNGATVLQWKPTVAGGFTQNSFVDGAWDGDGGGTSPTVLVAEGFYADIPVGVGQNWVRQFTP